MGLRYSAPKIPYGQVDPSELLVWSAFGFSRWGSGLGAPCSRCSNSSCQGVGSLEFRVWGLGVRCESSCKVVGFLGLGLEFNSWACIMQVLL